MLTASKFSTPQSISDQILASSGEVINVRSGARGCCSLFVAFGELGDFTCVTSLIKSLKGRSVLICLSGVWITD